MKNSHNLLGIIVFLLVFTALVCGCTGTQTASGPVETITPAATEEISEEQEWILWREGAGKTLSPLGDYQTFIPSVHSEELKILKIEVISDNPVTVMFFNKTELKNFENKIATNQGEYTPVSRYDNVKSSSIEESSEDYLSIVLYNPGDELAGVERANIWYKV